MSDPRLVFVLSPYQNAFFFEIADALVDASHANSINAVVVTEPGTHDPADTDVFVLLPPHEYATLEGTAFVDDTQVAARTIGISAEQPHQRFFAHNAQIASGLGAVFDFSQLAVDAYRTHGVAADRLVFGHVPAWDRSAERNRDVPALYFGNQRPRRLSVLAGAADALVRHDARLLISDNGEPNRSSSPAFVAGEQKRTLLGRTELVLNIHQSDEPYFEWLRMIDAVHGGAAFLSERSVADEPFVAGEHYLTFETGELGTRLDELVGDVAVADVARRAHELVASMPLATTVAPLIARAGELVAASRAPAALPARERTAAIGRGRADPVPRAAWSPGTIDSLLDRARRPIQLVPDGATWRVESGDVINRFAGYPAVAVGASGRGADGRQTLEGFWPWEPWRLTHAQHLGRTMIVSPSLYRTAQRWLAGEPWADVLPHLAVQVFAAAHGLELAHWSAPIIDLGDVPADPDAQLEPAVAGRVATILQP
ncbi:MAG: hypothetical protein AAFY28_13185 [Actinomycetota bacterium]